MEASAAVAAAAMEKEQNAQIETIRNLRWVVSKESVALVVESAGTTTPHNPATDLPCPRPRRFVLDREAKQLSSQVEIEMEKRRAAEAVSCQPKVNI